MTIAELVRLALEDDNVRVQILPFLSQNMTPDDLLLHSAELGKPESQTPKYVGIIVWVPFDDYQKGTVN